VAFYPLSPQNNPENPNIFPEYTQRARFHRLFAHSWDFILKETTESNWKTVKKFNLTEQKCWYKYTDQEQIIGLRFGTETNYGLYDIDWGSIHDPREQEKSLKLLEAQLELYGIVGFVLLQSSESQGLHLYFFLARPLNTFRLSCVMNKAAVDAGLEIKRGQLETFPNTKRFNSRFNGHRLPLQQGSYLLDKDYVPYSARLKDFLSAADWSAKKNDTDLLESRLESAYEWFKAQKNQERVYNPTPEDKDFLEQVDYAQREIKEGFLNQIRIAIEQGFTGYGETNELLLTIAKLGRILYGLSGVRYIDYIKETVMSCPGYLKYCRHQREIDRRCTEVARYGEKHWYPYRTSLPQNRSTYKYLKQSLTNQTNLNLERQHNAQSRIIQAVAKIELESVKLPPQVGECKLAIRNVTKELFGISVSDATLSKPENLPLWHPKYRPQAKINPNPTTIVEPEISIDSDAFWVGSFPPKSRHTNIVLDVSVPEVKENNTEELPTKIDLLPTPDNSTQELNYLPETLSTPDAPHSAESSIIIQKALQPEQPNNNKYKDRATPVHVIRQKEENPETPKALPSIDSKISCHTLPIMKGMILDLSLRVFYPVLQRAYCSAIIKKRNLVLFFQGYQGNSFGGLVKRKGDKQSKQSKIESIPTNSEVIIVKKNQLHSSYFRDYPNQILVYIKPLIDADDWQGGIAVPLELLSPLRIENKKKNQKNQNYPKDTT
jgi:hypothetical protein